MKHTNMYAQTLRKCLHISYYINFIATIINLIFCRKHLNIMVMEYIQLLNPTVPTVMVFIQFLMQVKIVMEYTQFQLPHQVRHKLSFWSI